MALNTIELRQKRAGIISEARKLLDKIESEKRSISTEEQNKYNAMLSEADTLKTTIDNEERANVLLSELGQSTGKIVGGSIEPETRGKGTSKEYRTAFEKMVRYGKNALEASEVRALNETTGSEGGFLVPTEFEKQIIDQLYAKNIMRQLSTVITTANDRDIPVVASHGAAAWTAEGAAFTPGDDAFASVTLSAYKAASIITVSEELLNDNAFNLESYIANEYARRIAFLEESAFVNGNGSGKPTGVIGSGTVGVTTASASAITSDEVMDLYYALGVPYRALASWVLNDATIKVIRKLKNATTGDYMWQPGMASGDPDRLLGRPVFASEHTPIIAATAKVAAFGDMSYYWIAQRGGVFFQRLNELYAANGQIGFRGYERVDGKLTQSGAVKIMQMHS